MKIFIFVLSLLFAQIAFSKSITGIVIGITDGDTITLLEHRTHYKVRLAGIDAPEKKQAFGTASKKSLSDLVYNKQVDVDWHKHDRYGRIVGKVLVEGVDTNLEQIKRGMAWYYKKYKNELVFEDRLGYLLAQENAEAEKIGLWFDKQPTPPWDFRKSLKSNKF
jgi:endonuclease YncB( thermonuclease family)